jgi:hypothetical protein
MFSDADVISIYPLQQAIADGVLVEIFKNRWSQLTGGKPLVATRAVYEAFSLAALQEIWNKYVEWRKTVQPTLKPQEDLFVTKMNDLTVWVLEDGESFTILFPDDY